MFNPFENPWLLLLVGILLVPILAFIRQPWQNKQKPYHMLIPIAFIAAAIVLDFCVKTDREKIDSAVNQSIKAAVLNDVTLIDAVVSQEYTDQIHSSKRQFLSTCRSVFATYGIKKIRKRSKQITLSPQTRR